MSWISRLFRRRTLERDLEKELRFHLDTATDDLVRGGLPWVEARRRAQIELGGLEQTKEGARDVRGTRWLEDLWTDMRYALRGMVRSPGVSAAAILTLAVGVGANTAVWSILDALMRRMLPVERPEELNALKKEGIEENSYLISHPGLQRLRAAVSDSIQIAAMGSAARFYATIGEQPESVIGQLVSGNYFSTLGVRPAIGRVLAPDDDGTLGGAAVVLLTDSFWDRRFGRDRSVLGRTIRINGSALTVVGVTQPGFSGLTVGQSVDVFVPLVMQHEVRYKSNASSSNADTEKPWIPQNGVRWLTLVARVPASAAAVTAARLDGQYRADLRQDLAERDSASRAYGLKEHLVLEPLGRGFAPLRQAFGAPLRALMGGVGLVLLITCASLAGLLLARSVARTHEIALRISLGASPGRLVRQTLTESLTLAVIGGTFGLIVAHWATGALLLLASSGTRAIPLDATLDGRVLIFAFAITIGAGLLFGLAPAVRVARTDLYDSFKTGGRVVDGAGGHRLPLGRALVIGQIALSLVLVVSAGVFVRTFQNLLNIDPGFERETLVTARLDVRAAGYTYDQLPVLYDGLLAVARGLPGVRSASLSLYGLAAGSSRISGGITVPGRTLAPGSDGGQENYVTPDYFTTVGVKVLAGRPFGEQDTKNAPRVAVISQAAARHFFGTDSVVGKRFGYSTPPEFEVVGVVSDLRPNSVREAPPRMVFYPLAQGPQEYATSIEVRVNGKPEAVIGALGRAIASVGSRLPVRDVVTMETLLERGLTRERLVARLAGSFGFLALLLAAIGLYGVISYSVARRTNEMGIRLALGASPSGVSWVVLRESMGTIVAGLAVGLLLWFPILGLTRRLLYGVSPHDPAVLAAGLLVLFVVGFVAALLPALRAARIDPIEAIRAE